MVSRLEGAGEVLGQESADGHTSAQPLGQRHDVGLDVEGLVSEQRPQAAQARLDLVEDQQQALLVAPRPHPFQVAGRRYVDSALALNGLQHDRHRSIGGRGLDGVDVVVVHVGESDRDRLKDLLVVGLTRGGHGHHSPAVKGVQGRDDLEGAVLVLLPVLLGQLDRALIGLGAAVADEYLVQRAVLDEDLRQLNLRNRIELIGCLEQRPGLLRDGVGDGLVGVAHVIDRPPGGEIQVFFPVDVPYPGAFAPLDDDGLPPHQEHVVLAFQGFPIGGHATLLLSVVPIDREPLRAARDCL